MIVEDYCKSDLITTTEILGELLGFSQDNETMNLLSDSDIRILLGSLRTVA